MFLLLLLGMSFADCAEVTVIGAGVIGMQCAITLLEAGYSVEIVTKATIENWKENDPYYASVKAGAWWMAHHRQSTNGQDFEWQRLAYERFYVLAQTPEVTGVQLTEGRNVFISRPNDWSLPFDAAPYVKDFKLMNRTTLGSAYSFGYSMTVPTISTPQYLMYLLERIRQLNGKVTIQKVEHIKEVPGKIIVNAAGLGARFLKGVEDATVYPTSGQLIYIHNPSKKAFSSSTRDIDPRTYCFSRNDGIMICGGTEGLPTDYSVEPDPLVTQRIYNDMFNLLPQNVTTPHVLYSTVGLRPTRKNGYRVELDISAMEGKAIIHAYGHGGAGFVHSFGTAQTVLKHVQQVVTL